MAHKCYQCVFEGEYKDIYRTTGICTRCTTLVEAINAHGSPDPCGWHVTKDDIIYAQENGKL